MHIRIPLLKPASALPTYLAYNTGQALLYSLISAVSSIYAITVAQLTPLQLVLVGTMLEASIFVFEIPTGVVADLVSRRVSVIIGVLLIGIGFIVWGSWTEFATILLAQFLWGVGYTFTSGASQAWISDEIGEEAAGRAFLKAVRYGQYASLAGVGLAVLLARTSLELALISGGVGFLFLGLGLMLWMPETNFHPIPAEDRTSWQQFFHTIQQGGRLIRRRPLLMGMLAIGIFYGLYSEGFDRLSDALLLERFTFPQVEGLPLVTWFALIGAAGNLVSAAGTAVVERWKLTLPRQLAVGMGFATLAIISGLSVFAISRNLALSISMIWWIGMQRRIAAPLYTTLVNHQLDPQVRATVLSMSSQVDAIGQITGGPLVGAIAQAAGIQNGLLFSAVLLTPALLLLVWQISRLPRRGLPSATGNPSN